MYRCTDGELQLQKIRLDRGVGATMPKKAAAAADAPRLAVRKEGLEGLAALSGETAPDGTIGTIANLGELAETQIPAHSGPPISPTV